MLSRKQFNEFWRHKDKQVVAMDYLAYKIGYMMSNDFFQRNNFILTAMKSNGMHRQNQMPTMQNESNIKSLCQEAG